MKRLLFFVNCLFFSLCAFSQQVPPEFPGGAGAMKSYFANNIRISEAVRNQGVSGKVVVRFIVQADGSIDSVRVVKSDYDFFNAEALRVVKNMPKWKPGSIDGKPVAVAFAVPINFKIEAGVDRNPTVPPSNVKTETVVANEVSFVASAPNSVVAGKRFEFKYEVNINTDSQPTLPDVDGLRVLTGPCRTSSMHNSYVNGRRTQKQTITYTYFVVADNEGEINVPGVSLMVDGKKYTSNSLTIEVLPDSLASQLQDVMEKEQVSNDSTNVTNDNLFVKAFVSKVKVYEQEALLLTYKVYTNVNLVNLDNPVLDLKGFNIQEVELSQRRQFELERYKGENYNTLVWRQFVLFPKEIGVFEIPAMDYEAVVVVQTRNTMDPFEMMFNGEGSVRKKIRTNKIVIDVEKLPAGKPEGFSGEVGHITLNNTVSPDELKPSDGLALKVTVKGDGIMGDPVVEFPLNTSSGSYRIVESKEHAAKYPTVTSVFGEPDEESWVNVYLDNSAKKIYLNKYDTDYKFSDGMLCVRNLESGLCGFIDEKGNVLKGGFCWKSPRMYGYPRFVDGVAIVKKVIRDNGPYVTSSLGAEWYILDKNGETIRLDYDISEATDFNKDGIAGILVRQGFAAGSALAFINKKGEIVYQNASAGCNMLQSMRTFNDGLAAYYDDFSRNYGYLNKAGEEVLPAEYFYAGDFSEGLAVVGVYVQGAPKYVYINTKGEVAFDRHFTNRPLPFTKGYGVATKTNGMSVLINKNGEICSKEYRFITNFNPDGLAFASNGATIDVLDTDLKIVSTLGGDIFGGFRFFEEYMNDFTSRYFNGVFWNGGRCFFDYKGNEVMIREGHNGEIKAVSQDGLYHVKYQAGSYDVPIDGFVDPKTGKYVFIFEKEEF